MDTTSYLLSQGWLGHGHVLTQHPEDGRGLVKPILVSQKRDNAGIGKKKHDFPDQWWLRGFEDRLKGLNAFGKDHKPQAQGEVLLVSTQQKEEKVKVVEFGGRVGDASRVAGKGGGGLYDWFRRGEGLRGTIAVVDDDDGNGDLVELEGVQGEMKNNDDVVLLSAQEGRKKRKRKRGREEDTVMDDLEGSRRTAALPVDVTSTGIVDVRDETKEERRERRRKRREEKARRAAAEGDTSIQGHDHDRPAKIGNAKKRKRRREARGD